MKQETLLYVYISPASVQDEERGIAIVGGDYLRKSTRYHGSDWKDYPYYLCSDISRSNDKICRWNSILARIKLNIRHNIPFHLSFMFTPTTRPNLRTIQYSHPFICMEFKSGNVERA